MTSILHRAACWFLHSGIQDSSGGVARYYRADSAVNAPVSNEITGYGVTAFAYLCSLDPKSEYRAAAIRAARYLVNEAWDPHAHTVPFEPGSPLAYFFDLGIIARGLLSAWRLTLEDAFRDRAREAALSMAFDFLGEGAFHPVISLPEKQPLAYEARWSRSPGCYQLKAALAWHEIGDAHASRMFESALAFAFANHEEFLRPETNPDRVMDRLHAYCYFLEAVLFATDRAEARDAAAYGIKRVAGLLREIRPRFERSDVCAQLLRARLIAHHQGALPLDETAAGEEAEWTAGYQAESSDPRLHGGFWFGTRGGELVPFMNPASTAFCMQALTLWRQHRTNAWNFELHQLI